MLLIIRITKTSILDWRGLKEICACWEWLNKSILLSRKSKSPNFKNLFWVNNFFPSPLILTLLIAQSCWDCDFYGVSMWFENLDTFFKIMSSLSNPTLFYTEWKTLSQHDECDLLEFLSWHHVICWATINFFMLLQNVAYIDAYTMWELFNDFWSKQRFWRHEYSDIEKLSSDKEMGFLKL